MAAAFSFIPRGDYTFSLPQSCIKRLMETKPDRACMRRRAMRNMKEFVRFALVTLCLLGVASAQHFPVDIFGGYSYLAFDQPASGSTPYEQLKLNGWDASVAFGQFHHFGAEVDISGHQVNNCASSALTCKNVSYMFGPRLTLGDRSKRLTYFAHALVGRDQADLLGTSASSTISDTSMAYAAGGGGDFWLFRHIGLQFGPVDYVYTNHLTNNGASGQGSFRAAGGIALRFGGEFPEEEPKPPKEPKVKSEGGHRSWIRPWHKSKPEPAGEPAEAPAPAPAPRKQAPPAAPPQATAPATTASRGMSIRPLGIVAGPQEFDGAKVLSIEPGSVAEMAALHVGDMIKAVDGKTVRTPMELAAELSDKAGKVRITIMRGDFATETTIMLGR